LPCSSKCFSLASSKPSIQGKSFFAAWSVCKITGTPYSIESSWTCFAPAIAPFIAAFWLSFERLLPALKIAPPLENWMITGAFSFAAVSKTPFMELEPITFTAGNANFFGFC